MSATPTFVELTHLNVADAGLLTAVRYGGTVYVGSRFSGYLQDEMFWIYGIYGLYKTTDLAKEGFASFLSLAPIRTTAKDLSADGAAYSGSAYESLVATLTSGATARLRWGIYQAALVHGAGTWEVKIYNAATGALASAGSVPFLFTSSDDLYSIAYSAGVLPDGSYTCFVRPSVTPAFRWPPPRFQEITGMSLASVPKWIHPDTGEQFPFLPRYAVGALPFMEDSPLRQEYLGYVAANTVISIPEFTEYLHTFNEDGTRPAQVGAWAGLRLVVGAGGWIGDNDAHPNACPAPVLFELDPGEPVNANRVPVALSPFFSIVRAFKEIDGDLFIGSMMAGRSGRNIGLHQTTLTDDEKIALGLNTTETYWCQCAEGDESVTSIARFPDKTDGEIVCATKCEIFGRVQFAPGLYRLEGKAPGGESLTVVIDAQGNEFLAREVETDFAGHTRYPTNFVGLVNSGKAATVVRTLEGEDSGPGTSALQDSVLCEYLGRLIGVADFDVDLWEAYLENNSEATRRAAFEAQSLCYYDEGRWHKIARWSKEKYYMTRVARCGRYAFVFGYFAESRLPVMMRLEGSVLIFDIPLDYYVRRADTTEHSDGVHESMLLTCYKRNAATEDNTVLPGQYVIETDGKFPHHCFTWDDGVDSFCIDRESFEEDYTLEELMPFLHWNAVDWCWEPVASEPDDGTWLELDSDPSLICYVLPLGQTMPYDVAIWNRLCYEGIVGLCWHPDVGCENADDCYDHFPVGTRVVIERFPDAGSRPVSAFTLSDMMTSDGQQMGREYPCYWVLRDSEEEVPLNTTSPPTTPLRELMALFTERVQYGYDNILERPAKSHIWLLTMIPPGFEFDAKIEAL